MWYERGWQWLKEHLTITVPGAVLIFAGTYILMLAVKAGQAGAAWVQAIGSIAAICAAIWISNRQAQRELQERRERECLYMLKALRATYFASITVRIANEKISTYGCRPRAVNVYLDQIRDSVGELERFSYSELADIAFADIFLMNQRAMRLVVAEIESFLKESSTSFEKTFNLMAEEAAVSVKLMRSILEKHCVYQGVQLDIGMDE